MSGVVGNEQHLSDNHLEASTSHTRTPPADSSTISGPGGGDQPATLPKASLPTRSIRNRQRRTTNDLPDQTPTTAPERQRQLPVTPANRPATRRSSRPSTSGSAAQEQHIIDSSTRDKKRVQVDDTPTTAESRKRAKPSPSGFDSAQTSETITSIPIDRKGKKRAARSPTPPVPEPALATESKRARRSSGISLIGRYDLRSKPEEDPTATSELTTTASKGKGTVALGAKGRKPVRNMPKKAITKQKKSGSGGPNPERLKKGDTSTRVLVDDGMDEDDSLWMDESGVSNARNRLLDENDEDDEMDGSDHDDEDDEDDDEEEGGDGNGDNDGPAGGSGRISMDQLTRLAADSGLNLDEATAAALFGRGFGMFGGMMSGMSNRFKRLKNNLQSRQATTRLNALRECSELLLVSNEDTLGSSFSPTNFATEFIAILNGKPNISNEGASDEEPPALDEMDEDAQLAAALALSTGNAMPALGGGNEDEMESQLLACRCLAHLMEALPGTGHTLVHLGAVTALCSKLTEISYIELAEQTLSTLEKISAEYPAAIVREGGLGALLNYLPFFSTNVQRTAVTAAANCCRNISSEHYKQIKEVFPILRDTLTSGDQRLVEQATLAVLRTIESYRHNSEHLEGLLDLPTVTAVNALLIPSGGSPLVSPSTYTHLLKALTTSARGSAKVSIAFLEAGMTNTIYQILTGVLPPSHDGDEQGESSGGQGLAGGIADMAVLQNLAHRPKDQVEEALALICELLPPVPRDGVFDPKAYTEKSLSRLKKGRKSDRSDKGERVTRRSSRVAEAAASSSGSADPSTPKNDNSTLPTGDTTTPIAGPSSLTREATIIRAKKEAEALIEQRLELLSANPELVGKFIRAVVPVLVDVYAASVVLRVRTKVLTGLVKAVAFAQPDALRATLRSVPMASFLCAIIASKDNPAFVSNALQLVELLVTKLPDVYQASFLREGVVFEIEVLAKQELAKDIAARDAVLIKTEPEEISAPTTGPSTSTALPPTSDDLKPLLSLANLPGGLTFLGEPSSNPSTPKKSSSYLDPVEANIIRARVLLAKRVFDVGGDEHHAATRVLDEISAMVEKLCKPNGTEAELRETLRDIASKFGNVEQALSSFELLKSGLVDGLLEYVDIDGEVSSSDRRAMLFETFSDITLANPSPLTMLVKRLHESLGRLEDFEVETAFGGGSDPTRPNGSNLARTLRVKLQAEDGQDVPKQVQQLSITIQAIAPMQALHDYLRPRVADGNYGSGLSRMFAAYASGMPLGGGVRGEGTSRLLNALAAGSAASGSTLNGRGIFGELSTAEHPKPSGTVEGTTNTATAGGTTNKTESSTGAGPKSPKVQRRRSARLSAQGLSDSAAPSSAPAAAPVPAASVPIAAAETAPLSSSAPEPTILPSMPMDMDFDDDYSDEDYDAEVFDEEMEEEITRPTERVVNMSVAPDGSRVEAKTPDGTRIATPQQNPASGAAAGPSGSGTLTPRTGSYAGAVKTPPANWHLEFFVNGNKLSLEDTIYGAVHRNQSSQSTTAASNVFNMPVIIKFKKVDGPADGKPPLDAPSPASVTSAMPAALDPSTPTSKVLRLLRVVHNLTAEARDLIGPTTAQLDENLFINNKLTAKLTRQLEETMILASDCLPEWAVELPKHFSFLFPFDTRYSFLQSTSFGYGRLISRSQSGQNSRNSHRRDDISHLARLIRQKVRISRSQLLESCAKVLELYGTSNGILEVEYFDEIGTGLGPTLEFYSLASKEFARRSLKVWRDEDESKAGDYVFHPKGLFPAPLPNTETASTPGSSLAWFKTLGLFTGRALLDSRIIDVNLNKVFLRLILGQPVKKTIATLKGVDLGLARSLERLQTYLQARKEIEALKLPPSSRRNKLAALTVHGARLADLSLDFTLPGYSIELKSGGAHIDVDDSNLEEYLERVLDMTLGSGIAQQVKAFQQGFSMIFSIKDMQVFSAEELGLLFGNAEEDWSRETLEQALKADHGYNLDSRAVQNLIEVMVDYDKEQRRQFLQFITGAPKLPIGGFRGLTPPFTVVRKPHEPPFRADDYLPSVMTCAQYLKMPDYSTKAVLATQLSRAMLDGGGSFHLS